jgi:hypothetical protein
VRSSLARDVAAVTVCAVTVREMVTGIDEITKLFY